MSRNKRYEPDTKKNRVTPDDFICTAQTMKEIAGDRTLRFVLIGKNGVNTEYAVTGDGFCINGSPVTDALARTHIARYRKNFERFFMEAAKKSGIPGTVISRFHIAKLADRAGDDPEPLKIHIADKAESFTLGIRRLNGCPAFEINGESVSRQEGEAFIRDHYLDFLSGYKKAMEGRAPARAATAEARQQQRKERRRAAGISSRYVDGELKVDISSILDNEKMKDEKRRAMRADGELAFSKSFFEKEKKKGYVPDEK